MPKKILSLFIILACSLQYGTVISTTHATEEKMQDYYRDFVGKTAIKPQEKQILGAVETIEVANDTVQFILDNGQKIQANDQTIQYNLLNPNFQFTVKKGDIIGLKEASEVFRRNTLTDPSAMLESGCLLKVVQTGFSEYGEPFIQTDQGFISALSQFQKISVPLEDYLLENPQQVVIKTTQKTYDTLDLAKVTGEVKTGDVFTIHSLEIAENGCFVLRIADGRLISAEKAAVQKLPTDYQNYWLTAPKIVVNLNQPTPVYHQKNEPIRTEKLIESGTPILVKDLFYDSSGTPYFELDDNEFVLATRQLVELNADYQGFYLANPKNLLTKKAVSCYLDVEKSQKVGSLAKNTAVEIQEVVLDSQNKPVLKLVDGRLISAEMANYQPIEDLKIYRVQQLLNQKYNQNNVSVYVQRVNGGEIAAINQTKEVHAASTGKLPEIYYTQKLLDQGKIKLNDQWRYIAEINDWYGAYQTSGSGVIGGSPTNQDYSVQDVLQKTCQYSDNVGANFLGYYAAEKYNDDFKKTINQIVGEQWDVASKKTTAEKNAKMMLALYQLGGVSLDFLSDTVYDSERISKNIELRVAHKIGDAYDFRHDVGIIYTDEPFVLSITTSDYTDYSVISNIADEILAIMS